MSYGQIYTPYSLQGSGRTGTPYSQTDKGKAQLYYLNGQLDDLQRQNTIDDALTGVIGGVQTFGDNIASGVSNTITAGQIGFFVIAGLIGLYLLNQYERER